MLKTYRYPTFPYRQSDEQRLGAARRHPVVIIGAGPIGLTAALDCAAHGIPAVVLDDSDTVSIGSRAVCYAQRPLEIWDRLGVGARMVDKGVSWQVGKVYFRDDLVYRFDLQPEPGHRMPAMINLQQYHLEEYLVDACNQSGRVDLRWRHKLISLQQHADHAVLTVETPDGVFAMEAAWVIACDGANSDTRRMVGGEFTGQFFQDRFLIADVVMKADFPTERWFWFEPRFHHAEGQVGGGQAPSSVLMHRQADDVWRIDFQLGWEADPVEAKKPENVEPRIRAMLGPDVPFELEWISVYQFACRRLDRFRHGRVLFAGDAAHQVSPFGARGANTGVQDVDNLVWKLGLVLGGQAPESLVDSYHEERAWAADDNLRHSTRSTDFITPKTTTARLLRDAVLELAHDHPFARPLVNSGRLSRPTPYGSSSLNTPDEDPYDGEMRPGTNASDAPVHDAQGRPGWLLEHLRGGFVLLSFGPLPVDEVRLPGGAPGVAVRVCVVGRDLHDEQGLLRRRYDGRPGTVYLIRPDQHVAARWRRYDEARVREALARCVGQRTDIGSTASPDSNGDRAAANSLIRDPHIADPDGFYAELVDAQRDLSDTDAQRMLARLVLLLANHVGDRAVLSEAIALAGVCPA